MSLIGSRIGRFQIVELLGAGGMGYVYKGYDKILGRTAALKAAGQKRRLTSLEKARFLREARVLSRLDHPNICRIYDLIEHSDFDFLVLEYIEGKTVKSLIQSGMDYQTKLKVVETVATVLREAHKEKIVHRDLKPENIMITEDGTVKVLDFGLARTVKEDESGRVLADSLAGSVADLHDLESEEGRSRDSARTTFGSLVGTGRYMSPEQARGEEATPASDLYTFGIIMQEMFTEQKAYEGNLPLLDLILFKVSKAETRPLEQSEIPLDPRLEELIKRLLVVSVEDRPNTDEILETIRKLKQEPQQERRFLKPVMGLAALLLLLAFFLVRQFSEPDVHAVTPNTRLALLPFQNETEENDHQWVEWGLRGLVAENLARRVDIHVVTARDTRKAFKSLDLLPNQPLSNGNLSDIQKYLGASVLVQARILREQNRFRIAYSVHTHEGRHSSWDLRGGNLPNMAGLLGEGILRALSPEKPVKAFDRLSENDLANNVYAVGIQQMDTVGPKVARDYFRVCIDLDPRFYWARFRLADCHRLLGEHEESRKLTRSLLREPYLETDIVLKLNCIRNLATISLDEGDFDKARPLFDQALELARKSRQSLTLANTVLGLGTVEVRTGNLDRADRHFKDALTIFREFNSVPEEAKTLLNLGYVAHERNELALAEQYYQKALRLSTDIGHKTNEARALINLGVLDWDRGDLKRAEIRYHRALTIYRELEIPNKIADLHNNLAGIAMKRGDLKEAEQLLLKAREIFEKLGMAEGMARTSYNLAEFLITRKKDAERAMPYLEQAMTWYHDDPDLLLLLSRVHHQEDRIAEALKTAEKARALAGKSWDDEQQAWLIRVREASKKRRQ